MDVNKARSGQLPEDTLARIAEKSAELGEQYNKNLILYDTRMSPGDIMAAAIIEEPDIVFVDTLRNIAGKPDRVDTRSWYDHVCLFLRDNVAKPLSTNVTVLHHLSRESFKDGRKPTIHDLMFAGESDSDLVILLHRPDDDNERKTIAEVDWIIGKSRFGWIGSEATNYDLIHQRFFGMTRQ
jgi:replicative DNA helicase